jgi:hypothetical protein
VKLQKAAEGFFVNKTFYRCLKMRGERLVYVVQEYEQQKILNRGGMSAVAYVGVGEVNWGWLGMCKKSGRSRAAWK